MLPSADAAVAGVVEAEGEAEPAAATAGGVVEPEVEGEPAAAGGIESGGVEAQIEAELAVTTAATGAIEPEVETAQRSQRKRRLPGRYRD